MAEREGDTLTRVVKFFADNRRWGKIIAHFEAGTIRHVETSEVYRPHSNPELTAMIGSHPAVAAALRSGEVSDIYIARVKNGQLVTVAVESHHPIREERPHDHHPVARPGAVPRP